MKKVTSLIFVILMISAMVFSGCSSSAPTSTGTPASTGAAAPVVSPASSSSTQSVINLKRATWMPPSHPSVVIEDWWANEITKRSNGRVQFKLFTGGQLSAQNDQLDSFKAGLFQCGPYIASATPAKTPLWNVDWGPWTLTDNPITLRRAKMELAQLPALKQELAKWNAMYLYSPYSGGPRIIMSNKAINTLDDLKGLKIRATGQVADTLALAGANPVTMPTQDIYGGIEKHTIDAAELPLSNFISYSVHEVTRYYVPLITGVGCVDNVMALDTFNSLPPDIQKIIQDVSKDCLEFQDKYVGERIVQELDSLKKGGKVTLIDFPKSEQAKFADLYAMPVMDKWVKDMEGKGLAGKQVFDAWKAAQTKNIAVYEKK